MTRKNYSFFNPSLIFGILFAWAVVASAPLSGPNTTEAGILFFGDWGQGNLDQKKVAQGMLKFCSRSLCEWGLTLGDNFYPMGVRGVNDPKWKKYFDDVYSPLKLTFRPVLGNHDHLGNIQAQIDYSKKMRYWWMPSRYYQFSHKNVDFFAIDTEVFDLAQAKWLKKSLSLSQARWKVVYGHHPIWSSGEHGDTEYLVRDLLPLLVGKAQFYLSGHDHNLEVIVKDGLNFVVSGAAAETRSVGKGKFTQFAEDKLGFSHLKFSSESAELQMLDEEGKLLFSKEFK